MTLRIDRQRVNALSNPLGIDSANPEFSWVFLSDQTSVVQTAYQVQVSQDANFQHKDHTTWDSGKTESDKPFAVSYAGSSLKAKTRYFWRVKVWDNKSQSGPWSSVAWFETGFLSGFEHEAKMITRPKSSSPAAEEKRTLYFRRFIDIPKRVIRGRLYATAHGWYKSFVNTTNVTADAQVPRWTPHHIYTEYQTYDVSDLFHVGENVLGAIVADGHFRGKNTILSWEDCYGDRLGYYALLELDLEDGTTLRFTTDDSWQAGFGRIKRSDPKMGEKVKLGVSEHEWLSRDCSPEPHDFRPVQILTGPLEPLVAEETERVGVVSRVKPTRMWKSPSGKLLVDFGQNFTGILRIFLEGSSKSPVVITYSEVLTTVGELNTSYINPMGPDDVARDEIIPGNKSGWFETTFSLRGYRYIQIDGLEESSLDKSQIEGLVVSTKLDYAGEFSCSDPRLEKFFQNVRWSMISNFQSTPMDCPTRERAGWLGDIQVFSSAAMYHADVDSYLRRFMRNVAAEQYLNGSLPCWIPTACSTFSGGSKVLKFLSTAVGWGDVSTMVPWNLYQRYGSTKSLQDQYASMKAWVDMLENMARTKRSWRRWVSGGPRDVERYVLDTGIHWGEWLRPGDNGMWSWARNILLWPSAAVPTAYLAESSRIMSETASLLNNDEDASYYGSLYRKVKESWAKSFITQGGSRIAEDKQDDYVRALQFGLVPEGQRAAAVKRLVELVKEVDYHLGSGFLSTHLLPSTLYDNGHAEIAFRLLQQTTSPSWLYPVEQGATSIWETWEGYNDKGEAHMSHNHYALGTITGWFIGGIAGLSNLSPGWRHILVDPKFKGPLTHASGQTMTPYGLLKSSWKKAAGKIILEVQIPAGATAEIRLGSKVIKDVGSGSHQFSANL